MTREYKKEIIDSMVENLNSFPHYYVVDIAELNATQTADLRRKCHEKDVKLVVVKNTLFQKALQEVGGDHVGELEKILKGSTSIMFASVNKAPALLIEEFRKNNSKPILKAAYVEQSVYVGDENLKVLTKIKSKEELVADVIALLQSPIKNVLSALKSNAGDKIGGLVKAIEEKTASAR